MLNDTKAANTSMPGKPLTSHNGVFSDCIIHELVFMSEDKYAVLILKITHFY